MPKCGRRGPAIPAGGKTLTSGRRLESRRPEARWRLPFPEMIWGFRLRELPCTSRPTLSVSASSTSRTSRHRCCWARSRHRDKRRTSALFGTKALVADHVSGIDHIDVSTPRNRRRRFVFRRRVCERRGDQRTRLRMRSINRQAFCLRPREAGRVRAVCRGHAGQSDSAAGAACRVRGILRGGPRVALVVGGGPLQISLADRQAPVLATTYELPGRLNACRFAERVPMSLTVPQVFKFSICPLLRSRPSSPHTRQQCPPGMSPCPIRSCSLSWVEKRCSSFGRVPDGA